MDAELYHEQLKDERWIALREEVLERDYRMCRKCYVCVNMQVHHKQYIEGRAAWEYDHMYLISLCEKCHKKEHEGKDISDFIKPPDLIIELGAKIRQSVWALKELAKRDPHAS